VSAFFISLHFAYNCSKNLRKGAFFKFFYIFNIEVFMELAKETTATSTEIRRAMDTLRLGEWTDDLLDEIEFDRRLEISLEQADKGLTMSLDEMRRKLLARKAKNGCYSK